MSDESAPAGDILCAVDFSACSEAALRVAAAYARRLGVRLHLLHVMPIAGSAKRPGRLDALAAGVGPGVEVVTAVESGGPAEHILRYARAHPVGLIVVGTHGRTGVSRAFLGSVSERVTRTAPCPVMTVPAAPPRAAAPPAAAAAPAPRPGRCASCGTDSDDRLCEGCRSRISGAAIDHQWEVLRKGRM